MAFVLFVFSVLQNRGYVDAMQSISTSVPSGIATTATVVLTGGSDPNNPIVGSGGGYGGFYCFAFDP